MLSSIEQMLLIQYNIKTVAKSMASMGRLSKNRVQVGKENVSCPDCHDSDFALRFLAFYFIELQK